MIALVAVVRMCDGCANGRVEMACVLGGMDIALCIVIVVVVVMGMIAALACLDVKANMRAMTVYN